MAAARRDRAGQDAGTPHWRAVVAPQDRLAGAWNVSAVHSVATFSVPYVVASSRASVEEVAATLVDSKFSGAAEAASVDVKDENLAAHLMTAELFDADNHPAIALTSGELKINFVAKRFTQYTDEVYDLVTGEPRRDSSTSPIARSKSPATEYTAVPAPPPKARSRP